MGYDLISMNWTAQPLSPEQLLVLRNVAALHLRRDGKHSVINFTHELCEGVLTRKSEGLFVTFVGTFFHADLGLVKGERWTVDFLLPRGSEHLIIDDTSYVIAGRMSPTGRTEYRDVDHVLARTSEVSLLD